MKFWQKDLRGKQYIDDEYKYTLTFLSRRWNKFLGVSSDLDLVLSTPRTQPSTIGFRLTLYMQPLGLNINLPQNYLVETWFSIKDIFLDLICAHQRVCNVQAPCPVLAVHRLWHNKMHPAQSFFAWLDKVHNNNFEISIFNQFATFIKKNNTNKNTLFLILLLLKLSVLWRLFHLNGLYQLS